jgi:hypothetical protein
MSELYSHLHEVVALRLEEAERVGYAFIPKADVVLVFLDFLIRDRLNLLRK